MKEFEKKSEKRTVTFQHRVEFACWKGMAFLLDFFPRELCIKLADVLGWLAYKVFKIRRKTIDQQLRMAFGKEKSDAEIQRIACKSLQNTVMTFFEFLQPRLLDNRGKVFEEEEGFDENIRPFLIAGKNAIVSTGHIGNWEAMGILGRRENVKLAAVAKAMHNPLVNEEIVSSRKDMGLQVLQVKSSMKSIVDAFRKNSWVAFVGDQDARRRGIFIDFFNTPASTATGTAYFSLKMGVPIVPVYCIRMTDKRRSLKLICLEPIWPQTVEKDQEEEEILRLTRLHTEALEKVVRKYPENYFWLHQRWKTRPKSKKKDS